MAESILFEASDEEIVEESTAAAAEGWNEKLIKVDFFDEPFELIWWESPASFYVIFVDGFYICIYSLDTLRLFLASTLFDVYDLSADFVRTIPLFIEET